MHRSPATVAAGPLRLDGSPPGSPYVGYRKDLRGVRSLWERFNAGLLDAEEPRQPYHQLLLDDWRRCSALGVDVAMACGRKLTTEDYRQRRQAEQLLIDTSVPIIRDVGHFLVDVPGILILSEGSGTILHISGDDAVRDRAASVSGIVVGSQWNERTAGTNGVGSALTRRQPVHVFATEHYCEGWHSWSCAAAPIFDIDGCTVLGVIDFTTVETDFRHQALGLSVSIANSIQARIALHRELERRCLLTAFGDATRHYPHDDLLALDLAGRPVAFTPNERCRQLASGWSELASSVAPHVRSRRPVHAPGTGAPIGSIVLIARPAGYARVFRGESQPAALSMVAQEVTRFGDFVSCDPDTRRMLEDLRRIAAADVNLLIQGETGTGKELIARHLHACSPGRAQPYLAINCGAISEHLLESTFFGYVRGAFSGADPRGRAGCFESAGEGTLFLDEVGELPPATQAALLRVLEDGSFQRVGSCRTLRAGCRIVAATHRNLEELMAEGRFREDLYYRLKVVQRSIRPLRERRCDIDLLADQFAETMRRKHGRDVLGFTPAAREALRAYGWPGNAREMRNAIEAAVLCADGAIDVDCLPAELRRAPAAPGSEASSSPGLARDADRAAGPAASAPASDAVDASPGLAAVRECERQVIVEVLRRHGNVSRAAVALGIARSTLYRKFDELGILPADLVKTGSGTS